MSRWQDFRSTLGGLMVVALAGCAGAGVVEDALESDGTIATEFAADDAEITLSARFDSKLAASDTFMVEWLFPDGSLYLRKPVRRSAVGDDRVNTSIAVRGKAPSRHPGLWRVELMRDGKTLVSREFEIRERTAATRPGAAEFARLAHCGPSRWSDPVISARRSASAASGGTGAWIGADVLEAAGATYSGVVLLTGCAPG